LASSEKVATVSEWIEGVAAGAIVGIVIFTIYLIIDFTKYMKWWDE
jgi:hypothetical protein